MKKNLLLLTGAYLAGSIPSSAVVLAAGWDSFPSVANSPPSHLAADTAATLSGTATGGSWDDWNNNDGASSDGTFGSLSPTIAMASTSVGTGSNQGTNLSLNRAVKPGTLTFTVTNNSAFDRTLEGFYFDGVGRFSQSAKLWTLSYSGAISGTSANGVLTESGMMAASAAQRDWAIDLTALADNVWEAGSDAIFTLTFTGGASATGTGGGHETLIDNVAITVNSLVPEPTSTALVGLAGAAFLFRRRRTR